MYVACVLSFKIQPMQITTQQLADARKSYELDTLDESQVNADPFVQFGNWLQFAIISNIAEPNAMTLATVGCDLRPSTRIVLIKGLDTNGLVWFTNYQSRKGQQLAGNPFAALQFHWVELERVVRIEGIVEKISDFESDTYFHSRPVASQIGACASPQSKTIKNRDTLTKAQHELGHQHANGTPLVRPAHWGGYRLKPDSWEFWQGRRNRLHDRLQYQRQHVGQENGLNSTDLNWQITRLAP